MSSIININMEKFNLTWPTYTDHLREMLFDLKNCNELTDVTLVSEDKKQFKAHKVILSASSPVFKSIISDHCLSNPIIYLKGIQSNEIESILEFIYLGQATFYQDRMNEFLYMAKNLEIKEISKNIDDPKTEDPLDVKSKNKEQVIESQMPFREPVKLQNSDVKNMKIKLN